MAWERIETRRGAKAFARVSKSKLISLNAGATEFLKSAKWAIFYIDAKNRLFAIEPLSEFEPGAVRRVALNKGKSSVFVHPEFVERLLRLEKCPEQTRLYADTSLTDSKQLVFRY